MLEKSCRGTKKSTKIGCSILRRYKSNNTILNHWGERETYSDPKGYIITKLYVIILCT